MAYTIEIHPKAQKWFNDVAATSFTKTAEQAYNAMLRGEDSNENRQAIFQSGYWSAQAIMKFGFEPKWVEALVSESLLPDSGGLYEWLEYLDLRKYIA